MRGSVSNNDNLWTVAIGHCAVCLSVCLFICPSVCLFSRIRLVIGWLLQQKHGVLSCTVANNADLTYRIYKYDKYDLYVALQFALRIFCIWKFAFWCTVSKRLQSLNKTHVPTRQYLAGQTTTIFSLLVLTPHCTSIFNMLGRLITHLCLQYC